jgi:membrane-associated protease RseP (regulator of RpoE activity)
VMSKRKTWRILLIFQLFLFALASAALLSVWLGLARAGFDPQAPASLGTPAKARAKAVVPFSMLPSNHMLVQAMINGKGPYRLIFDLGAPITLLSNQVSEASGVVKADAPRSFLFSMRGEAEVAKLQVGDLTTTKLPVIVFDHPALKILGDMLGRPVDGIIGFTFFARYRTTIDYQANQMTFEPVNFPIRDLLRELPNRLTGPKTARRRMLAPQGLWGLRLGRPVRDIDSPGVPIVEVLPGSPAALSSLKPGDVLTTLDNRWTTSVADAYAAAAAAEPGREIRVVILRDGKEQTLTVRPADGM